MSLLEEVEPEKDEVVEPNNNGSPPPPPQEQAPKPQMVFLDDLQQEIDTTTATMNAGNNTTTNANVDLNDLLSYTAESVVEGFWNISSKLAQESQPEQLQKRKEQLGTSLRNIQSKLEQETQPEAIQQHKDALASGFSAMKQRFDEETQPELMEKRKDAISDVLLESGEKLTEGFLLVASKIQEEVGEKEIRQKRSEQVQEGFKSLGNVLSQSFHNLAVGMNTSHHNNTAASMEQQQEEDEARRMEKEAEEACLQVTKHSLLEYLAREGQEARFEKWIEEFHPENTQDGALLPDVNREIDERFYIEESDHRKLWNEFATEGLPKIQPRTSPVKAAAQQAGTSSAAPDVFSIDDWDTTTNNDTPQKQPQQQQQQQTQPIDLLNQDSIFQQDGGGDVTALQDINLTTTTNATTPNNNNNNENKDLISFEDI